ncbi:MAG: hypothetical protein ACFFDS_02785 [Candidatus Thorarchaeota archaeon]
MEFDATQVDWLFVIIATVISLIVLSLIFVLKVLKFKKWQVRKLGHMFLHFYVAFIPYFFSNIFDVIVVLLLVVGSIGLLSLIPPINFVQRIYEECTREGEKKWLLIINSFSTAIVVLITFLVFHDRLYIFTSAVLSVSLGDGMGEMIGRPYGRIKYKIFEERSLEGSLCVLIGIFVSIIIAFGFNSMINATGFWWKAVVVSIIGMIVEACNYKFIDNTTLPFSIALTLFLLFEL